MYGKLFESMFDGTLAADWKALVTFQQLIILADKEGFIDITPAALSRRTGIPVDILEHGIEQLEEADKDSRSDSSDGRRIVRLDDHRPWGWQIVNYERYRNLANMEERREQNRARQQAFRDRQKSDTDCVTDRNANVTQDNACNDMKMQIADAQEKETTAAGIPLKDGSTFQATPEDIQIWQAAYPTLDIQERLKYISAWNYSNPTKQKTRRGIKGHILYMLKPKSNSYGSGEDNTDPNAHRHIELT